MNKELSEYEKLEGLLDKSFNPRLKRNYTLLLVVLCCAIGSFFTTVGIRTYQLHQIKFNSDNRNFKMDETAIKGNLETNNCYITDYAKSKTSNTSSARGSRNARSNNYRVSRQRNFPRKTSRQW